MPALAQSSIPTDLLTVPEVAALMRVSLSTVYGWIYRGLIPAYGVSQTLRISGSDLARPRQLRKKPRIIDRQRLRDLGNGKLGGKHSRSDAAVPGPPVEPTGDTATLASSELPPWPTPLELAYARMRYRRADAGLADTELPQSSTEK